MSSKVYELNGEEQKVLSEKCVELRAITRSKVMRHDAIDMYTAEIKTLKAQSVALISDLAKGFGLTRVQVINKILAENRKGEK